MSYPKSYYAERARPWPKTGEVAQGSIEVETCIIGGGLAGLSLGLKLSEANSPFVLLEAKRIAFGASGRNGGFVSAGYAQSMDAVEQKVGVDHAAALFELSVDGTTFVRKHASRREGIIQGEGKLKLLRYDDPLLFKANAYEMNSKYARRYHVLNKEELTAQLTSDTYHHALFDPDTFTIDPLAYSSLLKDLIEQKQVGQIFQNSPAISLQKEAGHWVVSTPDAVIKAKHVVLAGSAYQPRLYHRLSRGILPVGTYVVSSEPLGETLDAAIRFKGAISDTRLASDYYRRIERDSLLWGGRITTKRTISPRFAASAAKQIKAIYPQLEHLRIRHAWMGLMGYAVHKMPIVGEMEPGLWACTAFGGHGLSTTAAGADVIASAISVGDDRWRLFEPYKAKWGGGVIGRLGTQLVYWGMRFKDRQEEKVG